MGPDPSPLGVSGGGEDDDSDVNTLGLRWGDGPRLGGAQDEAANDAVSTITAPTIPSAQHPQNVQEEAAGDVESGGAGDTGEGDTDAVVVLASTPLVTEDTKYIVTNKSDTPVYKATPVEDGPLAFLQTNSGKKAAGLSGILMAPDPSPIGVSGGDEAAEAAAKTRTIVETDKRTLAVVENGKDIANDETVASQSIAIVNDSGNTAASARITTSTSSTENSSQYEADLSRAARNSMRDAVGAFRIEPSGSNGNNGSEEPQSSRPPSTSVDSTRFTNENLPTNIDIIAEATLVVDDEDNDADTLGVRWGDGPRLGGAQDEAADDVVSTITAPTLPTAQNVQGEAAGDIESGDVRRPIHACAGEGDTDAVVALASTPMTSENTENSTLGTTVYEATPVKDGPLAFLQTNSGKRAAALSGILIILPSIGLAVKFGTDTDKGGEAASLPEEEQLPYARVPTREERENGVIVFTGGDFCEERDNDYFPQEFIDEFPSPCMSGGILHQAIVDAQRRPHPFCDNIRDVSDIYIPGESQPVTEPNAKICQVTNLIPDVSLINTGAIRGGELPAETPITEEAVISFLPFSTSKISYIQVTADDMIKILNNAINFVTQEDPWNIRHVGAFPFASGLRYDVTFSAPKGEKVTNVEVLLKDANDPDAKVWAPIKNTKKRYWVVTNDWIASGGDGFLDGVVPRYIAITNLTYRDELIMFLENLKGAWVPPKLEEMSTKSFYQ